MTTKAEIVALLARNDKAIGRALVVLNERQTQDEQRSQDTKYHNGIGFTGADARMGTSMAQFFAARGYLSPKQLAYWRKPNVRGVARIAKYAGQLLEIANQKAQAAKMMEPQAQPVDDVGNMAEELMVLEERYEELRFDFNDTLDADDDQLTGSIVGKMEAVAERMAFLKKEIARAYKEMQ
jgi:hypothetical protein